MNRIRWAALACIATTGCMHDMQEESAHPNETFTEQAQAGATLYAKNCASCHGDQGQGTQKAPMVVGLKDGALPLDPPAERKKRTMQFVTVADVAKFVTVNMPAKDPGSLPEGDYWRILAFDLNANGIDLGTKHLDMALSETLTIPHGAKPPVTSQR